MAGAFEDGTAEGASALAGARSRFEGVRASGDLIGVKQMQLFAVVVDLGIDQGQLALEGDLGVDAREYLCLHREELRLELGVTTRRLPRWCVVARCRVSRGSRGAPEELLVGAAMVLPFAARE